MEWALSLMLEIKWITGVTQQADSASWSSELPVTRPNEGRGGAEFLHSVGNKKMWVFLVLSILGFWDNLCSVREWQIFSITENKWTLRIKKNLRFYFEKCFWYCRHFPFLSVFASVVPLLRWGSALGTMRSRGTWRKDEQSGEVVFTTHL